MASRPPTDARFISLTSQLVEKGIVNSSRPIQKTNRKVLPHRLANDIPLQSLESKAHAMSLVKDILGGTQTRFELVTYEEMKQYQKLRSTSYSAYLILCHANSRQHAGWLVCKYALSGHCSLSSSLKRFETELGTSTLRNHTRTHEGTRRKRSPDLVASKVGAKEKRKVIDAAVLAVVEGVLPISFTYGKKGMFKFAKALVEVGQTMPIGTEVNVADLLPSHTAVHEGISRLAKTQQEMFRMSGLQRALEYEGGVSSDGLKQQIIGKKFYDFTLHYFKIGKPDILTRERSISLVSQVLFLHEHHGAESASLLKAAFDEAVLARTGMELDSLMSRFTFVTDCASTMPCIVGASSSSGRVTFTETWLGCISHQINTVMKHIMNNEITQKSRISQDLNNVKTIVRVFKQGSWNDALTSGYALIQEVETRFGTTYSVVERFLKSASKVSEIIDRKASSAATNAFESLSRDSDENGRACYPALEAITTAFAPLRHMQTALEASKTPTIHMVLPMMEGVKRQLQSISSGMAQGLSFDVPHRYSQDLCRAALTQLGTVEVHPLWIAGCILHPRMRGLSFIPNTTERSSLKTKGVALIRRMASYSLKEDNRENLVGGSTSLTDPVAATARLQPVVMGETKFRLEDAFDVADYNMESEGDSLSKYFARTFSRSVMESFKEGLDVVKFWLSQNQVFPELTRVALRIFATPVSSATSERNFSAVNRIVTADRSRLKGKIIEDILYARSTIQNETGAADSEDSDTLPVHPMATESSIDVQTVE